jgi:hypothetical protein
MLCATVRLDLSEPLPASQEVFMASKWFHNRDSQAMVGPYTAKKFKQMAASGHILPSDTVRREGADAMVVARRVKGLFPPQVV